MSRQKKRIRRQEWSYYANGTGVIISFGVAYTAWLLFLLVLSLLSFALDANLMVLLPTWSGSGLRYLMIPVLLLLMLWSFIAWRHEYWEWLETAQPPELRLVTDLIRHADDFQQRARALEQAIEEAAAISKQIQSGIELEQQRLRETHQENLRERLLNKLTAEEVSAIGFVIAKEQARSTRSGLWLNIVIAVISWAAGVVTQALIDTDALRERLQYWL